MLGNGRRTHGGKRRKCNLVLNLHRRYATFERNPGCCACCNGGCAEIEIIVVPKSSDRYERSWCVLKWRSSTSNSDEMLCSNSVSYH